MKLSVSALQVTATFRADVRSAPADIQADATAALDKLLKNSAANALRLHALKGYPKPTIFKIDVRPDHSWQISFELDGQTAVLLRLATHRELDRNPRSAR